MLSLQRFAPPALALLLAATGSIHSQEPRPLNMEVPTLRPAEQHNQQMANAIAHELKASGLLRNFRIDVVCQGGQVEISGYVGDPHQRDEAARLVQGVPGVRRVINRLAVAGATAVTRTQFETAQNSPPAANKEEVKELVPAPRPADAETSATDPLPSFRAPAPAPTAQSVPAPMPPYSWPTYAPYNNYSRVAYPISYPDSVFPCIGPVYPFPKPPLGWRKVTLEYDDGHWWLATHGQKRDWWVMRHW